MSREPHDLLPTGSRLGLVAPDGTLVSEPALRMPSAETLVDLHRRMVLGRRFDTEAIALARQGRLAVYPSSRGQEAIEIGAVAAMRNHDWLFPTYRDSMAVVARGVDPVEVLTLFRGDWHCGYDPYVSRVAPQCTPLATNTLHAVGFGHAARLKGEDTVAVVMLGDGAMSEGDTHEALNFAAVWRSPVIFLVVNNGYAISVPLAKQTAAPSLAHKGIGYGIPSMLIDGNDAAAVYAAVDAAVVHASTGGGPMLIEAVTYRMEAHTTADDASRYRNPDDVASWVARDPLARLRTHLLADGLQNQADFAVVDAEVQTLAEALRRHMAVDTVVDPQDLFRHVYAKPTASLRRQCAEIMTELAESEPGS